MTKKNSLPEPVLVLGAGAWGAALAHQIAKKTKVYLWDRDGELIDFLEKNGFHPLFPKIKLSKNIQFIKNIISAHQVLIVTSSPAFIDVLNNTGWHAKATSIAWATKGIIAKSPYFLPDVFENITNELQLTQQFGDGVVLSGPSFAKEVLENQPTGISVASKDLPKAKVWANLLHSDYFRPYLSNDPKGVSIAGALKNIYAIASGVSAGLGYGANATSMLISRSLKEMIQFSTSYGAKVETMNSLAGIGDLILTCSDSLSRNRKFGYLLGQGYSVIEANKKLGKLVEGVNTLKPVYQLMQKKEISMPILELVYQLIFKQKSATWALGQLFSRKLKQD